MLAERPATHHAALVELHYRFALPVASLVLALVGIPLGLYTRKGGKATGLVLTILLVFLYYILMATGYSFAKQGRLSPAIGLWLANAIMGAAGGAMLAHMRRVRLSLLAAQHWFESLAGRVEWRKTRRKKEAETAAGRPPAAGGRILQILDIYIIRGWLFYLVILLVAFVGIYCIFDFFQLLGDIVRNRIAATTVFKYYFYFTSQTTW